MPSSEISKLQAVTGPRALSDTDRTVSKTPESARAAQASGPASNTGVSIEIETAVNTQTPPVDQDRVSEIREALRDGSYPLVPAQIADAIIAARVSFGMER